MAHVTLTVEAVVRDRWSGQMTDVTHTYLIGVSQAQRIISSLTQQIPAADAMTKSENIARIMELERELARLKK